MSYYPTREVVYGRPEFCSHCGSKMVIRDQQYGGFSRSDGHKLQEAVCSQIVEALADLQHTRNEIWQHDRADENQSGDWELYRRF